MCTNCNKNSCSKSCTPVCDPCKKQPKLHYCASDIECLGIRRGSDISTAIKKIGDKICEIVSDDAPYFIEVTYQEASVLKSTTRVEDGADYFIKDRGIYLKGIGNKNFSLHGHRQMKIVQPKMYLPDSLNHQGVFSPVIHSSVVSGDTFTWGAKIWKAKVSVSGVTPLNDYEITSDFEELLDAKYFMDEVFDILYDFDNDRVVWQIDRLGNKIKNVRLTATPYRESINTCDWGQFQSGGSKAYNKMFVYLNNYTDGSETIENNKLSRYTRNYLVNASNNECANIGNNQKVELLENHVRGSINNNICTDTIKYKIQRNRNNGSILFNTTVSGLIEISDNVNNGNIGTQGTPTARTTTIADTITNK